MKKICIILFLIFNLTGCSADFNKKEISEVDFIHTMGIDYIEDKYVLTALMSDVGSSEKDTLSITTVLGEGKTIFEAFSEVKKNNKNNISISHTSFFLIGDSFRKKGLKESIDFFIRDETIKMNAFVLVTQHMSAKDFIQDMVKKETKIHKDLETIHQKQKQMYKKMDYTISNLYNQMDNVEAILIPYIIQAKDGFNIDGLAVFKNSKLHDYLDEKTYLGYSLLKNNIKTLPIFLSTGDGLDLNSVKIKFKPMVLNNNIYVNIDVKFNSTIKEMDPSKIEKSKSLYYKSEILKELTSLQNEYINEICESAINYSITSGIDIFDIKAKILDGFDGNKADPQWEKAISNTKYNIKINSKITRSFIS